MVRSTHNVKRELIWSTFMSYVLDCYVISVEQSAKNDLLHYHYPPSHDTKSNIKIKTLGTLINTYYSRISPLLGFNIFKFRITRCIFCLKKIFNIFDFIFLNWKLTKYIFCLKKYLTFLISYFWIENWLNTYFAWKNI